jgi:hypothetical protein
MERKTTEHPHPFSRFFPAKRSRNVTAPTNAKDDRPKPLCDACAEKKSRNDEHQLSMRQRGKKRAPTKKRENDKRIKARISEDTGSFDRTTPKFLEKGKAIKRESDEEKEKKENNNEREDEICTCEKTIVLASIGYLVGKLKRIERDNVKRCRVILATYGEAEEAVNIPRIDTVMCVTPRSNNEQSIGRGLREHPEKNIPLMIHIDDGFGAYVHKTNNAIKTFKRGEFDVFKANIREWITDEWHDRHIRESVDRRKNADADKGFDFDPKRPGSRFNNNNNNNNNNNSNDSKTKNALPFGVQLIRQ